MVEYLILCSLIMLTFNVDEEDEMAAMEREVRGEEEFDFKAYLLK